MQSKKPQNKFKQGDVVWASFPLSDKIDKFKRRPALIISNIESNQLDGDYVILPITKTIRNEPFSFVITPDDVEGALPEPSELRCNKPVTVREILIFEVIGRLSSEKLEQAIELIVSSIDVQTSSGGYVLIKGKPNS